MIATPTVGERIAVTIEGLVTDVDAITTRFVLAGDDGATFLVNASVDAVVGSVVVEPVLVPGDAYLDRDGDVVVRSHADGWWFQGQHINDSVARRPLRRLISA